MAACILFSQTCQASLEAHMPNRRWLDSDGVEGILPGNADGSVVEMLDDDASVFD
jgi:hypothetical protein